MIRKKPDRDVDKDLNRRVRKRDEYKCRMCKKKKKTQIHHIKRWADAPELRFDIKNLISLCSGCHYSIRNKESYYEQYFWDMINGYK